MGTGTVNGATVVVAFSGFSAVGTATVISGYWSIATTFDLGLGEHTICVISAAGDCSTFTIVPAAPG